MFKRPNVVFCYGISTHQGSMREPVWGHLVAERRDAAVEGDSGEGVHAVIIEHSVMRVSETGPLTLLPILLLHLRCPLHTHMHA